MSADMAVTFIVLAVLWVTGIALILRILNHSTRRDDEAIVDHLFTTITNQEERDQP